MKKLSILLCIAGIILLVYALLMDTTVTSGDGEDIHNIGLIANRIVSLIASGIIINAGLMLYGFSSFQSREDFQAINFTSRRFRLVSVVVLLIAALSGVAWYYYETKASAPESLSIVENTSNDNLDFTVNLADSGSYLQTTIRLELAEDDGDHVVKHHLPEIRHEVIVLLSGKRPEDILSESGKYALSIELRNAINKVLDGKAKVENVRFPSFILN